MSNIIPDSVLDVAFLSVAVGLYAVTQRPDIKTDMMVVIGAFTGAVVSNMIRKEAKT